MNFDRVSLSLETTQRIPPVASEKDENDGRVDGLFNR